MSLNQPQRDAEIQRNVVMQLRVALQHVIEDVDAFQTTLVSRLSEPFTPHDPSPFARQAPTDDGCETSSARAIIWQEGLRELRNRLEVGLDAARTLRALCLHDVDLALAPLVVARPSLEAAVDLRVYVGRKPNDDRVAKFFAGMVRDMQRVGDPMSWTSTPGNGDPTALASARVRWGNLLELASAAGLELEIDPEATHNLGSRVLRVKGRGRACPVGNNVSSILGSQDQDLLHAWRLMSGATHGASWMTGAQFSQVALGESLGFAWTTGALIICRSLGQMCDDLARFAGVEGGYEERFKDLLRPAYLLQEQHVAENPELGVSAAFRRTDPSPNSNV